VETRGAWVDIAPVSRASERKSRRPVIAVVAAAAELTSAVQPLYNAGIRVDTIVTPAVALGSLARLRRNISTPNALELYVALEERATCLALVRGRRRHHADLFERRAARAAQHDRAVDGAVRRRGRAARFLVPNQRGAVARA